MSTGEKSDWPKPVSDATTLLQVDSPEVEAVAELESYLTDIDTALEALAARVALAQPKRRGDEVLTRTRAALWGMTVISYARCFSGGRPTQLQPDEIFGGRPDLQEEHDFVVGLRNMYVAHSIAPLEEIRVGFPPWSAGSLPETQITVNLRIVESGDPDDWRELMAHVREYVEGLLKVAEKRLHDALRRMSSDEIASLHPLKSTAPDVRAEITRASNSSRRRKR